MGLGAPLNSTERPMAEINVIPLVDVMLVLLVVFMVTAPLLTHAVRLDLPKARSHSSSTQARHIEIVIQRNESLYWNGELVSSAELEKRAAQLATTAPATEIHLKGDAAVPYGKIAQLLSSLSQHGLSHIGFVTDPGSPAPAPN
jgi:biopolymer transport protein ExbD